MSRQIIKQPNGKYCLFSSIVDNIIGYNMSKEDIIKFRIEEATKEIAKDIEEIISAIEAGSNPYYQFAETFESMVNTIRRIHGDKQADAIIKHTAS